MAVISCRDVWPEISNYVDGELLPRLHAEPHLNAEMDQHVRGCSRCATVVRGTQNIIRLYRDPRIMPLPPSLRAGLRQRIQARSIPERGTLRGLFAGLAVAGALAVLLLVADLQNPNEGALRAGMAHPAYRLPSDPVFVTAQGKLFHRAGCPFMHGPEKLLSASEALAEGYAPCPRCMKDALRSVEIIPQGPPLETSLLQ